MMKEMRSRPAWFLALAMLSLNGLMANAGRADPLVSHDPNKVTDLTFGIFCASKPDCSTTEKDTISGSISRHDDTPRMLRRTQTIPAIDGLMFGVMLRFQPPSDTGFLLTVDHPPLGPNRKMHESWKSVWESNRTTFYTYQLGLGVGPPAGTWTISASRGGYHLFSVEFEVVLPTPANLTELKQCAIKQVS